MRRPTGNSKCEVHDSQISQSQSHGQIKNPFRDQQNWNRKKEQTPANRYIFVQSRVFTMRPSWYWLIVGWQPLSQPQARTTPLHQNLNLGFGLMPDFSKILWAGVNWRRTLRLELVTGGIKFLGCCPHAFTGEILKGLWSAITLKKKSSNQTR